MGLAVVAIALPARVSAHGALQLPPSWHNPGGVFSVFLQPGQAHQPGAGDQNAQGCTGKHAPGQLEAAQGCAAEWYTNYTFANPGQPGSWVGPIGRGEPTIERSSPLRTYQDWNFVNNKPCTVKDGRECIDWTAHNPWRAPVSSTELTVHFRQRSSHFLARAAADVRMVFLIEDRAQPPSGPRAVSTAATPVAALLAPRLRMGAPAVATPSVQMQETSRSAMW